MNFTTGAIGEVDALACNCRDDSLVSTAYAAS